MALISHYPLNGTGEDILGNGPTNSLNFSTFQGEVVGGGAIYLNLSTMTGDYTISADIYRVDYVADWCIDFSNGWVSWGANYELADGIFLLGYSLRFGIKFLSISTKENRSNLTTLFESTKETIGVWYHAEIHRKNRTLQFYFNGKLMFESTHDAIPKMDHVFFFNAGSHQTGGGYVKNVKLYDSSRAESSITYYRMNENNDNAYGVRKKE